MSDTSAATVDRIRATRTDIWDRRPREIADLLSARFPHSGTFTAVMYAYAEIYHLSKQLYLYRGMVTKGTIGVREARLLLSGLLLSAAKRYSTWELTESARVLEDAEVGVAQAEHTAVLGEILDELLIYNNKVCAWLDACIPWFKLGTEWDHMGTL